MRKFAKDEISQTLAAIEVVLLGEAEPPNRDRAKAAIDKLFDRAEGSAVTPDTPLALLTDIPLRILNELDRHDIMTVGQLTKTPRTMLLLTPNLGAKSLELLDEILKRFGFALEPAADLVCGD